MDCRQPDSAARLADDGGTLEMERTVYSGRICSLAKLRFDKKRQSETLGRSMDA